MNNKLKILSLALRKKLAYDFSLILDSKFIKKLKLKLDYLSSLLKQTGEERDLFEEFVDLNSLKFIEWDVVKELGSGVFGTALLMRDGRVLKLSNSEDEAKLKTDLMNNLHNKEYKDGLTQPMIYDVGKLDMPEIDGNFSEIFNPYLNPPIFSITEKLSIELYDKEEGRFELIEKIPESIYQFFQMILKVVTKIASDISQEGNDKSFYNHYGIEKNITDDQKLQITKNKLTDVFNKNKLKVLKEYATSFDEAALKISDKYDLKSDWLDKFIKLCIHNLLEKREDIHLGNLGVRDGYFVFFDF
jgi:hypothetical protein